MIIDDAPRHARTSTQSALLSFRTGLTRALSCQTRIRTTIRGRPRTTAGRHRAQKKARTFTSRNQVATQNVRKDSSHISPIPPAFPITLSLPSTYTLPGLHPHLSAHPYLNMSVSQAQPPLVQVLNRILRFFQIALGHWRQPSSLAWPVDHLGPKNNPLHRLVSSRRCPLRIVADFS